MFVPSMDQMNVIASATRALHWPASMSVCSDPSPIAASSLFISPFSAKNCTATMPMTTQDTAVGRKYTDRKKRQPRTCSCSSAAMPSGMPIANGMDSSSRRVVLDHPPEDRVASAVTYALGPIQVAVIPSQVVIE